MSRNRIKLEEFPIECTFHPKRVTLHHRVTVSNKEGKELFAFVKRREAAHDTIQLEDSASCNLATATKEKVAHGTSYRIVAMAPSEKYCIDRRENGIIVKENNNDVLTILTDTLNQDTVQCKAGTIQKASRDWTVNHTESSPIPGWVFAYVVAIICIEF